MTSWSDDEDACRNNHSTMLQETPQGGVSNGTEQITPSEVVMLMAGSCAAIGTRIQIDESTGMFDPVTALGLQLNADEKYQIIRMGPCHPSKADIKTKQCGDRRRRCSENIFSHSDGTKRNWISYSHIKNALFCIPCLLFTDEALRGEHLRLKHQRVMLSQTKVFPDGRNNLKVHEASSCHRSAVVAQALFLQGQMVQGSFSKNLEADAIKRNTEVVRNRSIVKRIVDTIVFLGGQGLSLRGHREMLTSNVVKGGNFLEALKFLSIYDPTMQQHLSNVQARQCRLTGKSRRGRGSHLNFLSNDTQNKLVSIISQQTTKTIVIAIEQCRAWAIRVDTTPDVTSCEHLC